MSVTDEYEREVLRERAQRLAESDQRERGAEDARTEVVCVSIGSTRYALPLSVVREVARAVTVTPLPSAPAQFAGVARVRGRLVAVFELERLLARPGAPLSPSSADGAPRIVVVCGSGDDELGLLVETVSVERVRVLPHEASAEGFLRGVLPSGALLLDAQALFDDPRAQGNQALPGIER